MRILSLTIALAAITVFVSAQEAEPVAPSVDTQNIDRSLAALDATISEYEYRAKYNALDNNKPTEVAAQDVTCEVHLDALKEALGSLRHALAQIKPSFSNPILFVVSSHLLGLVPSIEALVQGAVSDLPVVLIYQQLRNVDYLVQTFLPFKYQFSEITDQLTHLVDVGKKFITCKDPNVVFSHDPSSCNALADVYRTYIGTVYKDSPLEKSANASPEVERLAAGTQTLLDLMATNSISSTNEQLAATKLIFAAEWLQDYRTELIRVAPSEEIKAFAERALGDAINLSNALEACLRVTSDPAKAQEELDEEDDLYD
ncbi:hypothetical protein BGZ94_004950 [Podila epigama]|nr:hypothetical protein BGZ94_004950 [Podila epigama]